VSASDSNGFPLGTASGVIALADQGKTIDVAITVQPGGVVQGSIFAGDGQTRVPSALVEMIDVATGTQIASKIADSFGQYSLVGVAGAQGFKIRAHSPVDFNVTAEATGSFASPDTSVTINLSLPIGIVSGTVTYSGATPAFNPTVYLAQTDANGGTRTIFGTSAGSSYTIVGPAVGTFTVTAQDSNGLFGTNSGAVTDLTVAANADVTLQGSGTVTGTVFDANNNLVPNAKIELGGGPLLLDRTATANSNGVYTIFNVALGTFTVAARSPQTGALGVATGTLSQDGETVTADIHLPQTGTVFGSIFGVDGVTPLPSASVTLVAPDTYSPLGTFSISASADAGGNYQVSGFPLGTVAASAVDRFDRGIPRVAGTAQGQLTANTPLLLDLTLGNAISLGEFDRRGSDGFRYDFFCDGDLGSGGNSQLDDAYGGAFFLVINKNYLDCPITRAAQVELNGTQLVIGPVRADRLTVTRKIFVPSAGGFARYLDVFTNPGDTPLTAAVQAQHYIDYAFRTVTPPESTGGTYAVLDGSGFCCKPALGFVFGGANAPVRATQFVLSSSNEEVFYTWNVTIPANQSVILMQFAVQRDMNDAAGAQAQAQGLADLSDPNALFGVSDADKAKIVNFVVH
jgi:hypothetical protein